MKPNDKIAIVDYYESIDHVTVFCGDGANDTGALKHASVGISLSDLEASVASPFTSQSQSIECVATIIQEGRCALVTSFGIFKPSFQARILSNIPYDMVHIIWSHRMMQFIFRMLIISTCILFRKSLLDC